MELEGPPIPLPSPATLQAFQEVAGLRRLPVACMTLPPWAVGK